MRQPLCALAGFVLWLHVTAVLADATASVAVGLSDPGSLTALTIEYGLPGKPGFTLSGRDARQQLIVTGAYSSSQLRDHTRSVVYEAAPAGIVEVSSSGLVSPIQEGQATITAKDAAGHSATAVATVTNIQTDKPINFPNQVVPVFTKFGCNGGGCHGKSGGQNGFKLSLLGFEPPEDYEYLVKEARGRRLFPAAPDRSLLLQKATGAVPHGGGARIEKDSPSYKILRRWIEQGLPYGKPEDPTVAHIEVFPRERSMQRSGEQQLSVIAHYTDGSTEDVTGMTQFDANDTEMAEISPSGLVKVQQLSGSVAVMARYQGHVDVFRASIPLGVPVENLPPASNFIDELVFAQLKTLGVPPSPVCDDPTFLRRSAIDIAGRLPTAEEAEQFMSDTDPAKREKWVDKLLASTDYAEYFANKWSAILRNKKSQETYTRGAYLFHAWIRDSLHSNKPYDQFVRDILTASGEPGINPAVVWYREVRSPEQQVEDSAQLFLGMRLQCARCHHHPFEKWSQEDYYGYNAFFSRLGRKEGVQPGEERIFHRRGVASSPNPKTGKQVMPTGLDAEPATIPAEQDPRQTLAAWMSQPNNPFFAPALVNRYWKHFFGRGLVDPEDDMRVTNPASNPALLEALSKSFVDSGFDMKRLVRTICTSKVYQLSSEPNQHNASDKQNFSRYYPKRLPAEVLLDAVDVVTETNTKFAGLPDGTRAVELPHTGFNSYFLTVFGRPESSSACECERTGDANLAQSLHLLNSSDVQGKLANGAGRAAKLAQDAARTPEQKIRGVYLQAYARPPDPSELQTALNYVAKAQNKQQAYEDVLWALLNTKEFLFNH